METIRIGDNTYNAETLTEQSKILLSDIQKVEGELGRLTLQTSIANLAKGTLIEKLLTETENLEVVEVSEEEPAE
jgi:hypothetical protein